MRRHSDTLRPGDPAPEFTLYDANGRAHSLRELLLERADLEGRPLQTRADLEDRPLQKPADVEGPPLQTRADLEGRPLQARDHQLLLVFDRGTW